MANVNDWNIKANRDNSPYRMWLVYSYGTSEYLQSVLKGYNGKGLMYAYNNKPPARAMAKLIEKTYKMIEAGIVKKASLRNNKTDELIKILK